MLESKDWNWPDPHPGLELTQIDLMSARAMALLVRNRQEPVVKAHVMHIVGAIEMIGAMEYHYAAFTRLHRRLVRGAVVHELHFRHEAVAYLNRMGQFVTFSRSELARSIGNVTADDFQMMESLMIFRNKYTAHRSIDNPRPSDTLGLQYSHARSLSLIFGSLLLPRPNKRPPDLKRLSNPFNLEKFRRQIWRSGFLTFQLSTDGKGSFVNFSLEQQHPTIMEEAYRVIERIVLVDVQKRAEPHGPAPS